MRSKFEVELSKKLKGCLKYCPEKGIFKWIVDVGTRGRAGKRAGSLHPAGYRYIKINGQKYKEHRLAYLYMTGYLPTEEIDHINGNRSDNTWANLRAVSKQCNARNRKLRSNNTSGINGVSWSTHNSRWKVQIQVNGKRKHLGYYEKLEDAISCRKEANGLNGYHVNHGRVI